MTALPPNASVCRGTSALLQTPDSLLNLTAAVQAASGQSLAPLCTRCCCGFLNHFLSVAFMVSLAFAIVVGNVITLTVFVQTRQSRTPQGYLKGKWVCHHVCFSSPTPNATFDNNANQDEYRCIDLRPMSYFPL